MKQWLPLNTPKPWKNWCPKNMGEKNPKNEGCKFRWFGLCFTDPWGLYDPV